MSKSEKFTIGTIVISTLASATLYGVWEDKVWLFAPLLTLIYIALAIWSVAALRRHFSDLRPLTSGSMIPLGGIMLLLFWLYSAVMIPFSVIPYEAKISTLRVGAYIGIYWATANILSRFPRRKAVWMMVFGFLILIALYSLVQHKVAPNIIFGMERYTGYWKSGVGGRLGGTYQCPNHIAHLFQMWIPFCLMFLFLPQFGWFWRICFGYSIPLFTLLIYQTQSRAGLLGLVASLATTALLLILRKSQKLFYIALLVIPLLGAGAIGGLWFSSSMFRDRMEPVVDVASKFFAGDVEEAISVDFRPQTWADGMGMFLERPFTGFGPGNYELVFPEYRQRVFANRMLTVHPHNEIVEMLGEYGIIGAILILGVLIGFFVPMIRWIKTSDRATHALPAIAILAALAGTAVHGFFDFELRIFPNALMLALLAGCAAAPVVAQRSEVGSQKSARIYLISVLRPLISILLLLAAIWAVQVMSSATLRVWGDKFSLAQDRARAEAFYKASAAIDPQNWRASLGLGQLYSHDRYYELDPVAKRELAQKEQAVFARAYRHNVKKEEVVYGLGRAELALGHREAGLDLLRQAAHYKRFNDFYWRKLGIELRKEGLYEEALKTFLYAQKLDRSNKTTKRNIQWLRERL